MATSDTSRQDPWREASRSRGTYTVEPTGQSTRGGNPIHAVCRNGSPILHGSLKHCEKQLAEIREETA